MIMGAVNSTADYEGPRTIPASKDFFTVSGLIVLLCTLVGTSGTVLIYFYMAVINDL